MSITKQLDFLGALLSRVARPRSAPRLPVGEENATLTTRCRELLHAAGAAVLARRVTARWNPRMRSSAGTAYPTKATITLNPRLHGFGPDEVDRTLRHELAHLLAYHRAGKRRIAPHGVEWRRACADLGLRDEQRCHTLPLPRRTLTRPHLYRCPGCALELRRVRPLRHRAACLVCCRAHNRGRYDERFRLVKLRAAEKPRTS